MKEAISLLFITVCTTLMNAEILEAPESQLVPSKQSNVSFSCRVRGDDLEWKINDLPNDIPRNTRLINMGVKFIKSPRGTGAEIHDTLTFPNSMKFNSTRVVCVSLNATGTLDSPEAVMIIAGPPLPPAPQLQELSATQLEVFWQEPFTWSLFSILSYNLTVYNTSSNTSNTYSLPGSQRSKVITRETETRVCSQLMFKVSARNGEGVSSEGTISGGFPVVPSGFPSEPVVEVKFTADGTPAVKLSFNPPEICSFQKAHYQVEVSRAGSVVKGEWQKIDNSKTVVEYEISSELKAYTHYVATLLYKTTFSNFTTSLQFSTAFHPTDPVTTDGGETPTTKTNPTGETATNDGKTVTDLEPLGDSSDNRAGGVRQPVAIAGAAVGGVLVVSSLTLILIIVVVIILRRQQRGKGEGPKRNSMVDNPLYEGPIYEVISENKKRKQLRPKVKVHAEESVYLDSPTQSMPRDCMSSYTNGAMVVANSMTEGKLSDHTALKLDAVESSLDLHPLQTNPYANTSVDPASEDAYTVMSPAQPATSHTNYHTSSNGDVVTVMSPAQPATSASYHTNYLASSNGGVVTGQYVVDASSPYSSAGSQKQVTLV